MNELYRNYLQHHGIRGQKWGVRNGPPYPLGASDHSAREKKMDWRKSLDKFSPANHTIRGGTLAGSARPSKKSKKKQHGLSERQKRAIKVGAAVCATALITYGTYKLAKSGKLDKQIALGKDYINGVLGKKSNTSNFAQQKRFDFSGGDKDDLFEGIDFNNLNFDLGGQTAAKVTPPVQSDDAISENIKRLASETGFKLHSKIPSIDESCRIANPDYDPDNPAYTYNCGKSVIADVLNSLGLNVKAKGLFSYEQKNKGLSWDEVLAPFKSASPTEHIIPKKDSLSGKACEASLSRRILEYANGQDSMGVFKMNRYGTNYGHYMKWQIKDGVVYYSNSQSGKMDVNTWFEKIANGKISREILFERLDDKEIDDILIKNYVTNRD